MAARQTASRTSRQRRRPGAVRPWTAVVVVVLAGGAPRPADSAPATDRDATDRDATERIGPLTVSVHGRKRMRGGRPEESSIEVAWVAPPKDPSRVEREELEAFERATFPAPGKAEAPRRTIIERPPERWMQRLNTPAFAVRWNRKTVEYLRYFRDRPRGQAMIRGWFRRLGRYDAAVRKIFRELKVPEDLVFVAMAESGFNPAVRSRVGAGGMWQFMESTGNVYGLEQDYWVDERFDVEKSTYAAALYLKDLRARFGSWELALAAYNAGTGLVMTSVRRHNTNNFWALSEIESGLPYSTTNYVPKIVAGALVGRNRRVFRCDADSLQIDPAIDWVDVRVAQSTSLETVASAIGDDAGIVKELNAQLIRGRTPPSPGGYTIRIPRDRLPAWKRSQDRLRAKWVSETTHTIRHGEKLATVAARHDTTERKLRKLNGIEDSAELTGGLTLVVPKKGARPPKAGKAPDKPIAAVPHVAPPAGHKLVFFETTRASTPSSMARAFGVDWDDIVAWNDLDERARIQAGQVLQIVVTEAFDGQRQGVVTLGRDDVEYMVRGSRAHLETALARRGLVRRGYKVRRGDTLKRISKRFKLSLGDLARINGFSRRHEPHAGDIMVVYVRRGRTRGTHEAPSPPEVYAGAPAEPEKPASKSKKKRTRKGRKRRAPSTSSTSKVPGRREAKDG